MRPISSLAVYSAFVSLLVPFAAGQIGSTVTVYAWPLSAASPTPFAKVILDTPTTAKLVSVTLPKLATADEIIRVGLYDARTKSWTGVAASAAAFDSDTRKKLTLHVDEDGQVYYVGYGALPSKEDASGKGIKKKKKPKPKTAKALEREERERQRELKHRKKKGLPVDEEEPFVVEVVGKREGPRPVLSKPVVLNAEGRVEGVPDVESKTFLQK